MASAGDSNGRVDRQSTAPFHLKLFYRTGKFNSIEEFHDTSPASSSSDFPPHLQIYTWMTCTLRELSHLLTTALPNLLPDPAVGTRLAFRLVFPDTRSPGPGRFLSKDLGSLVLGADGEGRSSLPTEEETTIVTAGPMAGELSGEPDKTLRDGRFIIGDYVSCAIFPPQANGAVAPPPMMAGQGRREYGGGRPGRENGYDGYRGGRGAPRGVFGRGNYEQSVPAGEWRRGERLPDGPSGSSYGRGRGRGRY